MKPQVGDLAICNRGVIGRVTRIKEGVYYGERLPGGERWQTVNPRKIDHEHFIEVLAAAVQAGRIEQASESADEVKEEYQAGFQAGYEQGYDDGNVSDIEFATQSHHIGQA